MTNKTNFTNEERLKAWTRMLYLKWRDTKRGLMNENWEPTNHLFSAEEFKNCWEYLAKDYTFSTFEDYEDDDKLYMGWQSFLALAKRVARKDLGESEIYDMDMDECMNVIIIANFLNRSGIPETTWIKFFDSLPER